MSNQRDIIESLEYRVERGYISKLLTIVLVLRDDVTGLREEYPFPFTRYEASFVFGGADYNAFIERLVEKAKQRLALIWEAQI